ncbi:MAG: hypothetical protein MI784_13475 [Cytophagales bacterium]|nr:hypothetical protein [Cytophagales bacterium]
MESFFKELSQHLGESTGECRKIWAKKIVEERIPIAPLLELLKEKSPVNSRFSWLLGDLCELNPDWFRPLLPELFLGRHRVNVLHYDRSVARWLNLAGIPEEIEGEAVDQLFEWLLDPKIKVATKAHSAHALFRMCKKYPELGSELRLALEDQRGKNTDAFRRLSVKLLRML